MRHEVDSEGNQFWYNDQGDLHREGGPAVIWKNGEQGWLRNGLFHREEGPALIKPNISYSWYLNDKLHRIGGPAVEYLENSVVPNLCYWYIEGILHLKEDHAKLVQKYKLKQLFG
jgi:hypothetical protein